MFCELYHKPLCWYIIVLFCFFFQAEDGIRDLVRSRGLGDVYKRQVRHPAHNMQASLRMHPPFGSLPPEPPETTRVGRLDVERDTLGAAGERAGHERDGFRQ